MRRPAHRDARCSHLFVKLHHAGRPTNDTTATQSAVTPAASSPRLGPAPAAPSHTPAESQWLAPTPRAPVAAARPAAPAPRASLLPPPMLGTPAPDSSG